MSLKVNRFEPKVRNTTHPEVVYKSKTGVIIKDHKTDIVIAYINLNDNAEENKELADRIITTIEEYIEEKENASEN